MRDRGLAIQIRRKRVTILQEIPATGGFVILWTVISMIVLGFDHCVFDCLLVETAGQPLKGFGNALDGSHPSPCDAATYAPWTRSPTQLG